MGRKKAPTKAYFRASEVCQRLGIARTSLWRRVEEGTIPSEMRGQQRVYPAAAILALERADKGTRSVADDQGKQDAKAIELLAAGATDGEVIRALRMSLERVGALRKALRHESEREETTNPTRVYENRLAEIARRRAAREGR